jgi:flagellar hook-associated protein 3 FlgL
MSNIFLQDMHSSLKRLMDVQKQISSQQKYGRPSDNPAEVTRGMTVGTSIARNDQYQRNLDDAVTWLSNTDTALEQATNLISSIREKVIYAGDGGLSQVDLAALAREIEAMRDELIQTANFDVEGRFLLSGFDTSTRAFIKGEDGQVVYQGDEGRIVFEIEKDQTGQVSLNGRDVFPLGFERRSVTSVEVPLDFRWEGTSEELRIQVGDKSARVPIRERWNDTNDDSVADPGDYDGFRSPGEKVTGYSLAEIAGMINNSEEAGKLVHASVVTDAEAGTQRLVIQSLTGESLRVTSLPDTDGFVPVQRMLSQAPGVPWAAPADGTLELEFASGGKFTVDVSVGDNLDAVAQSISMIEGIWAGARTDGSITIVGTNPDDRFSVIASGGATDLFPVSAMSEPASRQVDTAHIGLASFLGLETATVSTHSLPGDSLGDTTTTNALDVVFVSGERKMNLVINDEPNLTLQEFADRLKAAAGDWLEVVVQEEPEAVNPTDPLSLHKETESLRLLITTKDGAPLSVYDKSGSYANDLGISSALVTGNLTGVPFPNLAAVDVPALLGVEAGGTLYRVALLGESVDDGTGLDPEALAREIRQQVGSDVIGVDLVNGGTSLALYSKTGEPLRVMDLPYADPDLDGLSSGLAIMTGLQAGVTGDWIGETVSAGAPGRFVVETAGRRVEVTVAATDTVDDLAKKLGELGGSWLDVSITSDGLGNSRLALAAKDGSAVNVFDLTGGAANTFGINTDVRVAPGTWAGGGVLSVEVDGYQVDIDLADATDLQDVAEQINARFAGGDLRAELAGGDMVLKSPVGKAFTIGVPGGMAVLTPGDTTPLRSASGSSGPFAQTVTTRTGADVRKSDLFGLLDDLVPAVEQGAVEGLSDVLLPKLDAAMDDILSARATVGALTRRYETALSRLKENNLAMTDLYSGIMDVDIAEAATELQMAQVVYQATLSVISRILQPTLVDYLS